MNSELALGVEERSLKERLLGKIVRDETKEREREDRDKRAQLIYYIIRGGAEPPQSNEMR
jgi:hypothetical protein